MSVRRILLGIIMFIVVVLIAVSAWFMWVINAAQPSTATEHNITIADGSGVKIIATQLEQQQLIRSRQAFIFYALITRQAKDLQAGDYYIDQATIAQIVSQIAQGRVDIREEKVTLIEGWNRFDIQNELRAHQLDADGFVQTVVNSDVQLNETLLDGKPKNSTLEGYLFPDTYTFTRDESGKEMIQKMVDNMQSKLTDDMKQKIAASEFTFYEILTLASIVEKEVSKPEDRPFVAGVFIQRTKDDYFLESDATVNYVTGKSTTRPTGEDITQDSQYNTYKYKGLPPGPISNPSIDSIRAVLEPTLTDYYYFLATPEGETLFSTTYEEHLQKRYQYYGY